MGIEMVELRGVVSELSKERDELFDMSGECSVGHPDSCVMYADVPHRPCCSLISHEGQTKASSPVEGARDGVEAITGPLGVGGPSPIFGRMVRGDVYLKPYGRVQGRFRPSVTRTLR